MKTTPRNRVMPLENVKETRSNKRKVTSKNCWLGIKKRIASWTEFVEHSTLKAAFWLDWSTSVDRSYSFENYQQKVFRDKIVEEQAKDHNNKERLYHWIKCESLNDVIDLLRTNPGLINDRDCAGATPIHAAYLFQSYEIAHYLVERYPMLALKPYDSQINPRVSKGLPLGSYSEKMMPYTGENILHMVIVRRNHKEVRWILDFYHDHRDVVPGGLYTLFTANATGMFFERGGNMYFGGFPLHFAVCSNDTAIFDLVLAFASCVDLSPTGADSLSAKHNSEFLGVDGFGEGSEGGNFSDEMPMSSLKVNFTMSTRSNNNESSIPETQSVSRKFSARNHFGSNVIFMRDNYGNNCLHLCVLHCLQAMYTHVYSTALAIVERELRIRYAEESIKKKPGAPIELSPYEIANVGADNGHCVHPRAVFLPQIKKFNDWVTKVAKVKLEERLVVALNRELHSPLTLAASQIKSSDWEANNEKKIVLNDKQIDMLKFLLSHLKEEQWVYGPVRCSLLALNGVEIRYDRGEYIDMDNGSTTLAHVVKGLFQKEKREYKRMFSAIEWLCLSDADRAIIIPEIQKIIQIKWERFGYPKFLVSLLINSIVCILITLILLFVNSTPASNPSVGAEYAVNLLYSILVVVFFWMLVAELHYIYYHPHSYLHTKGVVKFSRTCCWFKMISFAVFCILKTQQSYRGVSNHYFENSKEEYTDNPLEGIQVLLRYQGVTNECTLPDSSPLEYYHAQNFVGIKICLSVCVLFSWLHIYYFLMGFDKTGPFILTIFRIVSRDVPYFLKFYAIVVVAFACVLSMLSNNGDFHAYHGIDILIQAIYTLIQKTVNEDPTHDNITPNLVARSLSWLSDLVLTSYYCVVVLIMLNLLIAMINHTYDRYTEYNESLLLMEKYNIMHAFELAMTKEELKTYREKFAIIQSTEEEEEDRFFAEGDKEEKEDHSRIPMLVSFRTQLSKMFQSNLDDQIDELNKQQEGEPVEPKPPVDRYTFEMQDEIDEWWDNNHNVNSSKMRKAEQQEYENTVIRNGGMTMNDMPQQNGNSHCSPSVNQSGKFNRMHIMKFNGMMDAMTASKVIERSIQTTLLIIDPQCDFHPEGGPLTPGGAFDKSSPLYHKAGSLAVAGANEDSERVAAMIRNNMKNIREIIVTMDSHYPTHIAHAIFWMDAFGESPSVFTKIYHTDVKQGVWRPRDKSMQDWCEEYTNLLERKEKMVLTIWPEHCIVGSRGHAVVPSINASLQLWAEQSGRPITYIMKGQNCRTEMYSAIEAEVEDPRDCNTGLNSDLIDIFKKSDQLIVCGEAMSHCVNYTVRDIVKHWHGDLSKIVLLKDGASPVPGFEKEADKFVSWARDNSITISTCEEMFNGFN